MSNATLKSILDHIQKIAGNPFDSELDDAHLLERFLTYQDAGAFTTLVRRHGPMIRSICQRALKQPADADDVFQATFLVLLRKAHSIRKRQSLASWLYGVAYRVALRANRDAGDRQSHERRLTPPSVVDPVSQLTWQEVCAALDEELNHLPERHRAPLVLCYLENQTRDEAAAQLGWSVRTLKRRLLEGRRLLHARLSNRGLALPAALLAVGLSKNQAGAHIPALLLSSTVHGLSNLLESDSHLTSGMTAHTVALAESVLQGVSGSKLTVAALILAIGMAAVGWGAIAVGSGTQRVPARSEPEAGIKSEEPPQKDHVRTDKLGDPLPPGAIARFGTTRLLHAGPVDAVAFTKDRKSLASAGRDNLIRLWDLATGKELRRFTGHKNWVVSIAFSPDGNFLASASYDLSLRLWEVETGKEIRQFQGHSDLVNTIAYSADGRHLASGSSDKTIRVWEVHTGKELRQMKGPIGPVGTVKFLANDQNLVSSEFTDGIRIWNVQTGEVLRHFGKQEPRSGSIALSSDGSLIASGHEHGIVCCWETATGKKRRQWTCKGGRAFLTAFSPDDKLLATGGIDGPIEFWDVATAKKLGECHRYNSRAITLTFSSDGKTLASGWFDHRARLWEVATGEEISFTDGPRHGLQSVAFSPDGKTFATTSYWDRAQLWNLATGKEIQRLQAYRAFGFASQGPVPEGGIFAYEGWDKTIYLRGVTTGKTLHEFRVDDDPPMGVAFRQDGKMLAASLKGQTLIRIWDLVTRQKLASISGWQGDIVNEALSPDGKYFAAQCFDKREGLSRGTVYRLRLWNLETAKELPQFDKQYVPWGSILGFSPDGRLLAMTPEDQSIQLWDLASGKPRCRLSGETSHCCSIAFSADNRTVASGHADGSIDVWEVATGQRIHRLEGHQARVFALAFSPSDAVLASGSEDAIALLWDLTDLIPGLSNRRAHLRSADLESLWNDLAGADAGRASRALAKYVASPGQSVPFLKQRLESLPETTAAQIKQIPRLMAELDSKSFADREQASKHLAALGKLAEPALRGLRQSTASPEVRRRAEALLNRLEAWNLPRHTVTAIRVLQVLEQIGSEEAKSVLTAVAKEDRSARQAQEAIAALERLARRASGGK